LTLAAVVALAAAVWIVASSWLAPGQTAPAPGSAPGAELRLLSLGPRRKASPAPSPDGRWLAWSSDVDGDWDVWRAALPDGVPENLTADSPEDDISPTFSPDGRSLAYATVFLNASTITLIDLDSREVRKLAAPAASGLCWSADGKEILFSDRPDDRPNVSATATKLFALDVATSRVRMLSGLSGSQPDGSGADGAVVFVAQGGGRTDLWRLARGGGAERVTDDEAIEWSPVTSLDGRHVYYGRDAGGLAGLYRTPLGEAVPGASAPQALTASPLPGLFYLARQASSPAMVLIGVEQLGRLFRLELDERTGGATVHAFPERYMAALAPAPSPDGKSLAFIAVTSQEDLALSGPDGSDPRRLTDDAAADRVPRWSPDGERLAFLSDRSGTMEIWTIRPDGTGLERLTEIGGVRSSPVWSPDGTWIAASAERAGAFRVRADGARTAWEPLPATPDGAPFEPSSWSPDGERIAGSAGDALVVHSFATGRWEALGSGTHPLWIDARRLLCTRTRELVRVDTRTGEERSLWSFAPARVSPWIGTAGGGRTVWVSLSLSAEEVWAVEPRN
jgi:Tol biopolymer transport system component